MNKYLSEMLSLMGTSYEALLDVDKKGLSIIEPAKYYKEYDLFEKFLLKTISKDEPITIVSDYDTDGVCSYIMYLAGFSLLGCFDRLKVLIPDSKEGYGFNLLGLDRISQFLADSGDIYTADNGVLSDDAIMEAKKRGYNVIVTDHHLRVSGRSQADVVIDPNQEGCPSSFKSSSGAMVVWKLFQQFFADHFPDFLPVWDEMLLYGAISTVGDMMPLVLENRAIVKAILWRMNQTGYYESLIYYFNNDSLLSNPSYYQAQSVFIDIFKNWNLIFEYFINEKSIKAPYDASFFGFYVSPLFNAPRRVSGNAYDVYFLYLISFLTFDSIGDKEAFRYDQVASLFNINDTRKAKMQKLMRHIEPVDLLYNDTIALGVIDAHSGYGGLVSGQVSQKLLKPSIIFSLPDNYEVSYKGVLSKEMLDRLYEENPLISASGRSGGVINLHKMMSAFNDKFSIFVSFGGHEDALGVKLYFRDYIDTLVKELPRFAYDFLEPFSAGSFIDMPKSTYDLDLLYNAIFMIEDYGPFGVGFQKPYFKISLSDFKDAPYRVMGKDGQHIKWDFNGFSVIYWNGVSDLSLINSGSLIGDVYGEVNINSFRGVDSLQYIIKVVDVRNC